MSRGGAAGGNRGGVTAPPPTTAVSALLEGGVSTPARGGMLERGDGPRGTRRQAEPTPPSVQERLVSRIPGSGPSRTDRHGSGFRAARAYVAGAQERIAHRIPGGGPSWADLHGSGFRVAARARAVGAQLRRVREAKAEVTG